MSTPSPGPGWWLASDGKWYPQQWEYMTRTTGDEQHSGWPSMMEEANRLGQQGWEMVGFQLTSGSQYFTRYVKAFFKRPIAP
ncbi:hypothetical protein [Mycobacterium lentiflavum]|nr:hypothetical protein [Mycobacterium lentiflavum]